MPKKIKSESTYYSKQNNFKESVFFKLHNKNN